MHWDVPVELSEKEEQVASHLERIGKFFVFLRRIRHRLFDDAFQEELKQMYGTPRGNKPLPPAMLAMVTLLQAYDGRGDADAVVTAKLDRRWQLVLGNLDSMEAPFSQGVLPKFRQRLAEHDLDVKLLERTVELAQQTGLFGWHKLKAALDSSPLIGAGRVEDEFNLIGRAMDKLARHLARCGDANLEELLDELGLTVLEASSFKAAFDIRWSDTTQRNQALNVLVEQAERLLEYAGRWLDEHPDDGEGAGWVALLEKILDQNLEPDPDGPGKVRIKQGVAPERITSISDPEMRHGRKSDSKTYTGYQRHILRGAEVPLIFAAMAQPANQDEAAAAGELVDQAGQDYQTLLFDRGYLASDRLLELESSGKVELLCKPWPQPSRDYFSKTDFDIDLEAGVVSCPAGHHKKIPEGGGTVCFGRHCRDCPLREQCTEAKGGRTISVHPRERLMQQLRELVDSSEGRRRLRRRVTVEHGLARIQQLQGSRARYRGTRKNSLDLRRHAAVANLQAIAHQTEIQESVA